MVTVSLEHSKAESGLTADVGADIETGTSTPKGEGIRKVLRRYTRRQSEVYAESTHLLITVEDSGAGISTVFPSILLSFLSLRIHNLLITYHYAMM